ncbi:MAG: bifunctional adenosylcobinamide kinase/adenosylcobinamide-phosphate guanylyltransferase [Clostridiales bacterium]|nr:bifunctional adenosylcobinamide kinase/adenosylcobinamide-phosphate guanylyltransferase [Clostridiales bacterium]
MSGRSIPVYSDDAVFDRMVLEMILVIGGASQGKDRFACGLLMAGNEIKYEKNLARGGRDLPDTVFQKPYVSGYQEIIRTLLEEGRDPETFTSELIAADPELVVMDEVGSGIVPISRDEREYREAVGRAGQLLAAHAEQVYRVICGIGMRIK